jgi:MFS family permease
VILRAVKPYFYDAPPTEETSYADTTPPKVKQKRPIILDLWTIRASMTLEMIPYVGLALNPNETWFVILSVFATFGSASSPTANSLALSLLPSSSEAGRLFGGLAVLHALGATIISPLMYGTVFAATVGTYAPTVFIIASCILGSSWILFALVRLDKKEGDTERGRSRRVKTVRSSSRLEVGPSGRVRGSGKKDTNVSH